MKKRKILNLGALILSAITLASCNKQNQNTVITPPIESKAENNNDSGYSTSLLPTESKEIPTESTKKTETETINKPIETEIVDNPIIPSPNGIDPQDDLDKKIPDGYYDEVNISLTDASFRKNLSEVINKGFVHKTYKEAYDIIAESDEDPNDSSRCICLYSGRSISKTDHSPSTGFNREHTWAKSHGFKNDSSSNPYCDCHHLRVTGMTINSTRSNSDFYEFKEGESYKVIDGCKYTPSLFEPRDEVKGDVARIMFYMATMYGFDGLYNLTLTNDTTTKPNDHGNGKFGNLDTLVKWSIEDPVSQTEIYRNNVVYSYQKNRNPYIDHPEYVAYAYPESAAKFLKGDVDQSKVDDAISKINAIPSTITLEHENIINNALDAYNKLNYSERALVSNYSKLTSAIDTLNKLKTNKPDNPDTPLPIDKDAVSIDLTNNNIVGNKGTYSDNLIISTNEGNILFTYGYLTDNEARLGTNKTSTIHTEFEGEDVSSAAMICDFNVQDAKKIVYNISQAFDNVNYKIYFCPDGGNYRVIKEGSIEKNYNNSIEASLDTKETGKFAFVIISTGKMRLTFSKIDIYQEK